MTVYLIAQLKITDRATYDRYQARFWDVFRQSNGRLLAADENPSVLEGRWDGNKVVMMSFPDEQSAYAFFRSPPYQEISRDRQAGAETISLLVTAFSPPAG